MQFEFKSCAPEEVGVKSDNILRFLDFVKEYKMCYDLKTS